MPNMGQLFREAREKKGVTISQAALATRMKLQTVQYLENNALDKIAAPAYAKGFIRLYAEYLGLDPAPLIREYQEKYARPQGPVLTPEPKKPAWRKAAGKMGTKAVDGLKKVPRGVWLKLAGGAAALLVIWFMAAKIGDLVERRGDAAEGAAAPAEARSATPGYLEDPPEPYWDALDPSMKPAQDGANP